MSPLEIETMRRKLARIAENLELLRPCRDLSGEDWTADAVRQAAAERWLQLLIDAAIDINAHLLVAAGHAPPPDAHTGFLDLARKARAIGADLAAKLAPSAGLRNHLVHRYDELDDRLVLEGLRAAVDLYPEYVAAVSRYLDAAAD